MGWNYLSIPKLQRLNRWSLGMDKLFPPMLDNGCNYLSMLGLKLNHVSKKGHSGSKSVGVRRSKFKMGPNKIWIKRYIYSIWRAKRSSRYWKWGAFEMRPNKIWIKWQTWSNFGGLRLIQTLTLNVNIVSQVSNCNSSISKEFNCVHHPSVEKW